MEDLIYLHLVVNKEHPKHNMYKIIHISKKPRYYYLGENCALEDSNPRPFGP